MIKTIFYFAVFCCIFIVVELFSFLHYGEELLNIKYLSVNIVGSLLLSIVISFSLFKIKKGLVLFFQLIPLFTWYKSTFYIEYNFIILDPFIIMTSFFSLVLFLIYINNLKLYKLNKFFLILTSIFFLKFLVSIYTIETYKDIYFVINEFFEPFLFSFIILLTITIYKKNIQTIFNKIMLGFFITSATILLTEMLLRSGGKPWLFLLHGGRRGYAGTTGDLTAGLGEPVIMGLLGSFFIFYFLFFNRNKFLIIYTLFISLLSIAKSALLVLIMVFVLIYSNIKYKIWKFIPRIYLIIIGILSIPLIYTVYLRFIGAGKIDTKTNLELGDVSITSDVNLIQNIHSAISWADNYFNIEWYYQFLLLPLVGGINNVVYLQQYPFVFIIGCLFTLLIFINFFIFGNYFTKALSIVIIIIYSYYGAFAGNPYAFYYQIQEMPHLGYVPREEPTYLLILLLWAMEITKQKGKRYKNENIINK